MSTTRAAARRSLLTLAYLAFVSLGLPDGLIGVGWPSIRSDLGVPTEAVGLVLAAGTAGYMTSSVVAGFTIARLGVGWLLAGSTALASLALTGYALSPALALIIGCALLLGLGSGAIDSGLNAYAAGAFGARHMNWLHAAFGFGATLGPLVMTSVLGLHLSWRWGYGVVAATQFALATAFALTAGAWRAPRPRPQDPAPAAARAPARGRDTLALPAVWLGALAFGVYAAIEIGAGLWAYLLLTEGRGLSGAVAGVCVSGYWGSLFVGRLLFGVVAERLDSARVLMGCLISMAAGALLVAVPAPAWVAAAGLFLIGFAAAPVFPLLTLTTADRVGAAHADQAIGMQVGGAGLGGAIIPAGIGVLLSRIDVEALGPALLALSVILLALYVASIRRRPPVPGEG